MCEILKKKRKRQEKNPAIKTPPSTPFIKPQTERRETKEKEKKKKPSVEKTLVSPEVLV